MKSGSHETMVLEGRKIEYSLVSSRTARKLRVRVRLLGVDVVLPRSRTKEEACAFLRTNSRWLLEHIDRAERLRAVRRSQCHEATILYQGAETPVRVEDVPRLAGGNRVFHADGVIVIVRGKSSGLAPAKSLENWLRRQARQEIRLHLDRVTARLRRSPGKVFVMGQRTKWGNCSPTSNLSFNWRLIMTPEFVLRYLVTHEAVHLAIPDHSQKFWLTVRSLCHETERAKQWLSANAHRLMVDLRQVVPEGMEGTACPRAKKQCPRTLNS